MSDRLIFMCGYCRSDIHMERKRGVHKIDCPFCHKGMLVKIEQGIVTIDLESESKKESKDE